MLGKILQAIFGSKYERDQKRLAPILQKINSFEPQVKELSDELLKAQTAKFKKALADGSSLDDILPEAFATVREASLRTLGMRHFDVQMLGGIALHQGSIAEMKTGEGKTLTSTLPIYLNALAGQGVHVVTVNDYLARRDANWMRPIYEFLGLRVSFIQHDMEHEDRQAAYSADITYGTNNEFGFDYLRDNMVSHIQHKVQRSHFYAIVDEVDSILIDEARTPLIISGSTDDNTGIYIKVNKIIPSLRGKEEFNVPEPKKGEEPIAESAKVWHYEIDEKGKNVLLTELGVKYVEGLLGIDNLYAPENVELIHHIHQALKAHKTYIRDVEYVVQNNEVLIVDEFTGRLMPGRRYSDGLHQAIEAKENVPIAKESQTLASITFQNYFRIYTKLAGMTGTADTEAEEFAKIYKLDVVVIPPNIPMKRMDYGDRIYKTEKEKFNAIVNEIKELHDKGQPILVGTISIEKSERLSELLTKWGLPHNVLNAKFHEKEADIVADAGKLGMITIATNMAGRGTDIVLGGSQKYKERLEKWEDSDPVVDKFKNAIRKMDLAQAEEFYTALPSQNKQKIAKELLEDARRWLDNHNKVVDAGGLHILGTERHESRRIDNQLRGRSGRQGDPGSSRFYLSLEDDLMRIFGGEKIQSAMQWLGLEDGQEIEHKMVSNGIARAQKRVEGHNFDIRKHLLEYDDVMNRQRKFIYELRNRILESSNISDIIRMWIDECVENQILLHCEGNNVHAWDIKSLNEWITNMNLVTTVEESQYKKAKTPQLNLFNFLSRVFLTFYEVKSKALGEGWQYLERNVLLEIMDHRWKEHLYVMDNLRDGIWTVGYGEKNPLVEYKLQGFRIFDQMVENLKIEVISFLFRADIHLDVEMEDEPDDYVKVGEEQFDYDMFGQSISGGGKVSYNTKKADKSITTSAGGGSKRKKNKRKKR
jgi:preprotein translocase subunit SecA